MMSHAMAASNDDDNVTNSLGLRSERQEMLVPSRNTYSETLKIAALYAGRWFGPSAFAHVAREHLQHIIRPNSMDVFLTVDPTSWCVAPKHARTAYLEGDFATAEHELTRQARVLFDFWPRLHVALVSAEDPTTPHSYGGRAMDAMRAAVGGRINPTTGAPLVSGHSISRAPVFMYKWFPQYDHVAKSELLRRAFGPHDVIVRLRLDVSLTVPITFLALRGGLVRVVGNHSAVVLLMRRDDPTQRPQPTSSDTSSASAASATSAPWPPEIGVVGYYTQIEPAARMDMRPCKAPHQPWSMSGQLRSEQAMGQAVLECPKGAKMRWQWSDWLQIGTPRSMAHLASMTADRKIFYTSNTLVRCFGLCQEEQTALHLEARGVRLLMLNLPIAMVMAKAIPCGWSPLLNDSELMKQHKIPGSFFFPCTSPTRPPNSHARGCTMVPPPPPPPPPLPPVLRTR